MESKKIISEPSKEEHHLPPSEKEWLATNKFDIEVVGTGENLINSLLS